MLGSNKWRNMGRKSTETTVSLLSHANRFISQGQRQAAIELLEESVSRYPHDRLLLRALGRLYLLDKQPDKAVIYLRRALSEFDSISNNNNYDAEEFSDEDAAYIDELAEDSLNDDFSVLDDIEAEDPVPANDNDHSSHTLHLKGVHPRKAKDSVKRGTGQKVTVIRKGRKWRGTSGPEDATELIENPKPSPEQSNGKSDTPYVSTDNRKKAFADTGHQPEELFASGSRPSAGGSSLTGYDDHTGVQLAFDYDDISNNEVFEQPENVDVDHQEFEEEGDYFDDELSEIDADLVDSPPVIDDFSEDFDWDDLDDFEEEASRDSEDEELAQTSLTRAERARQVAVEVLDRLDWDREHLPLLETIFVESGWGAARIAIENLVEKGAVPEQISLARQVRLIWFGNEYLWTCFRMKSNVKSMQAEAVYKNFSWADALRVIRCFPSIPDVVEVERFIDEAFDEWYSSDRLRQHFRAFLKYLRYRIGASKRTLPGSVEFIFQKPVESDWGADNPQLINPISIMRTELREIGADSGFEVPGVEIKFRIIPKEAFETDKEFK